jgi:histidinol-phosphate phosphatase family protein
MINQAVIFCGGYGRRLMPLTKDIPKPMVVIDDKPFLYHLIQQCKNNGIKNILLLCGYKYLAIKNYFKNGKKLGVKIRYHYDPPNVETLKRIYNSKNLLRNKFLVLYSDNYSSLNIRLLESKLKSFDLVISLCKKIKGNILINEKRNKIINYSKCRNRNFNYVEIGYMIMKKKVILNKKYNINKEFNYLIQDQVKINKVNFLIKNEGYQSISNCKRLILAKKFFLNKKIILLDRDGVINLNNKKHRYVRNLNELKINKIFLNKYKNILKKKNILCITNQAGISTGDVKLNNLKKIHNKIKKIFNKNNINIADFFVSKHHFNEDHYDRKPNPGMFIKASKKYKFFLDKTIYIGDDTRDIEAAYRACCRCIYIGKKRLNKLQKFKYKFVLKNFSFLKNDSSKSCYY